MKENYPDQLLNYLNDSQQKIFYKLLNKKTDEKISLIKELNKSSSSLGGLLSENKSYKEILVKIANKNNIPIVNDFFELEEKILQSKFQKLYDNLDDENKKQFDSEIKSLAIQKGLDPFQVKALTGLGTLALLNASGFGMYLMASTLVGGLTSLLGVTLPFAFYTGMSSILSIITGPVGWIAGFGALAYTLRNENRESIEKKAKGFYQNISNFAVGNFEFTELLIAQICSFRILKKNEFENEIENLNNNIKESNLFRENVLNTMKKLENENEFLEIGINQFELNIEELKLEIRKKESELNLVNQQKKQNINKINSLMEKRNELTKDISLKEFQIKSHEIILNNLK